MLPANERIEKIRSAPKHSTRILRKRTPEEKELRLRQALEHDNDAGLSAVDEYVFLKHKETAGR